MNTELSLPLILVFLVVGATTGFFAIFKKKWSLMIGFLAVILGLYFLNGMTVHQERSSDMFNFFSIGFGAGLIIKSLFKIETIRHRETSSVKEYGRQEYVGSSVIDIKSITKEYFSGVTTTALKGVDLKITEGEFVAIMGPSGSGKSTLMHILGLLDTPTSGSYLLAGKEVSSLSSAEQAEVRNRDIGFVFQQFNLLPRTTVMDNVLLPTIYSDFDGARDKAVEIIKKVGLADRVSHKSNELSGGQIQRVAIARALMMSPHIILADEPTGNLDSATSDEIMYLFKTLNNEGITIIMVTHEEGVARHAKRIIRLKDGHIVSDKPTT